MFTQPNGQQIAELLDMANAMPQLVWVGVPDGAVIYINDKVKDYQGAVQLADGSWDWHRMIHPDDLDHTLRRWEKARAEGAPFEVEHRLQTIEGEYRWHLNRARPQMDLSGSVLRWFGSSTDVHLQKEAERALRASEAEFRASFENASVGMAQIDAVTGSFLRVNQALCRMLGYTAHELVQREYISVLTVEEREPTWAYIQEIVGGLTDDYQSEKIYVRKDGGIIWCLMSANPILDEAGQVTRISLVIRDITRKKKAEDALLDSEAKFKAFLHDSPLLAWSKDEQGRYVYLNSSFEKRFNVQLVNWKGKTDVEIHQAEFAKVFRDNDLRVLATGEPLLDVEHMLEADGSNSYWSSFKFCYQDSEGNRYVGGIGYDITKQRIAEKASQQAREQLELTFRNVPTGIMLFNQQRQLVFVNRKGTEFTGFRSVENADKELTLQDIRDLNARQYVMYTEDGKLLTPDNSPVQKVFQHRESNYGIYRLVRKDDGSQQWINYVCTPVLSDKGEVELVIATITDITLQKEAEQLVLQEQRHSAEKLEQLVALRTRELQESNEGLQQFAHVASHDLKEPVRKVKVFGSRIREEFGEVLPERARLYLDKMEAAADRMFTMIDGVLQYSSLQALPDMWTEIDLNLLMRSIESDLEVLIQQKHAEIRVAPLPTIQGISLMVYQLFYNLVNNALKFAHKDAAPVVEVSAENLLLENVPYYRIRVSDNGIGFEAGEAERIFQTFARLHPKDMYDGTGLGLSLCRKIVERHEGTITAASEPGKGSVFIVTLPATPTRRASL